jgi:hypothetical protein
MIELEILKACADLKPRIMESLYAQFGKTPSIKPKSKSKSKAKPKRKPKS